jgi:tRNA modification GTPase
MNFTDTIAAIATPLGEGGVGIIRISGEKALDIGISILRTQKGIPFTKLQNRHVYYGIAIDPQTQERLDEVLFFYARKPGSYTAEDVLEVQAHGGMFNLAKLLQVILANGARMAGPGEFTLRAFINGRIDLVQAESIIDLIRSKTERAHELAMAQLSGTATRELNRLESHLYQVLIAVEAVLDFPEEGLPELEKNTIITKVTELEQKLIDLASKIDEGRKLREGVQLVIAGRPNVGKSSLLNAFIREERAIVTEIPGTTRDIIEAQFQMEGIPFILIDTAGVRETDNSVERIGIAKAERTFENADLIILVLDGSQPWGESDQFVMNKIKDYPLLVVVNKADLPIKLNVDDLPAIKDLPVVEVSSLTREGFTVLEKTIIQRVGLRNLQMDDRPLLSRIRHKNALEKAVTALQNFKAGIHNGVSEDLLAVDLRSCLAAIAEITGKNVGEEVIKGIFANFCIGK